ncbi:hypothetical protein COV82_04975 [Candidatus Peregrinibacteria bacterium CG11_big_fil_rev_8_21_14_0_20_46_8]|nr:MAG: hypothetical protein COV82_04975 [Candidatus Peregrinibacteria bacterium CG11_big_fil_rev_8_21_14_0_20_46_8]
MSITYQDYIASVEAATDEGRIIFADSATAPYGPPDAWGHLDLDPMHGRIGSCNTRPLDSTVKALIENFAHEGMRCLEGGAGLGRGVYEINQIANAAGIQDIEIDTVARTPIAPDIAVMKGALEIIRVIKTRYRDVAESDWEDFSSYLECNGHVILLELLCKVQNILGVDFLRKISSPYVRTQYIGSFPEDIQPEGLYDFYFDVLGAFEYTDCPEVHLRVLKNIVKPSGAAVFDFGGCVKRSEALRVLADANPDELFLNNRVPRHGLWQIVWLRPEHPLARFFRAQKDELGYVKKRHAQNRWDIFPMHDFIQHAVANT